MDVKSFLKSASLIELLKTQEFLEKEIRSRQEEPKTIKKIITFTDGASRGNPGHAGIGALLFDENEEKLVQDYQYIGQCTNNEAEYRALLMALDRAYDITRQTVECYMDSELLVRQINGQYALKSEKLAQFFHEVKKRAARFTKISFHHVRREHPKLQLADKLANRAIDEAKQK